MIGEVNNESTNRDNTHQHSRAELERNVAARQLRLRCEAYEFGEQESPTAAMVPSTAECRVGSRVRRHCLSVRRGAPAHEQKYMRQERDAHMRTSTKRGRLHAARMPNSPPRRQKRTSRPGLHFRGWRCHRPFRAEQRNVRNKRTATATPTGSERHRSELPAEDAARLDPESSKRSLRID
jgi:hypothetical protein